MRTSTFLRAAVATTALALVLPVGPALAAGDTPGGGQPLDGGQPLGGGQPLDGGQPLGGGQPLVSRSEVLESGPNVTPTGPEGRFRSNAAAAGAIGSFTFSAGAIHAAKGNFIPGTVTVTRNDVRTITSRLTYSGKTKGTVKVLPPTNVLPSGFYVPARYGAGLAQLGPSTVTLTDGTTLTDTKKSNQFRVRYGLHPKTRIKIERRGSKLTFKSRDVRYYKIDRYVRVRAAYVQVLTKSGWRTLKTIHPNTAGSSTFSIRHSGKRHYRLAVKTTTKLKGGATKAIKI